MLAGFSIVLAIDIVIRLIALKIAVPIFERCPPFQVRQAPCDQRAQPLRFSSSDGLTLAGSVIMPVGQARGLIVFFPEYDGTQSLAAAYLDRLVEAGFALFAFDFRNQGDSDHEAGYSPSHWLTDREMDDALAALRYIANDSQLRELPLGLFGASRGGNAALVAAARVSHVRAVATEGAFSTDGLMDYFAHRWAGIYAPTWLMRWFPKWHFAGTIRLARWVSGWRRGVRYAVLEKWLPQLANRPVLLISGGRDSYVATSISERLRALIGPGCNPVWVVPGAKHNQARWTSPEEFERRLVAFYEDALGGFRAQEEPAAKVEETEPTTTRVLAEIAR